LGKVMKEFMKAVAMVTEEELEDLLRIEREMKAIEYIINGLTKRAVGVMKRRDDWWKNIYKKYNLDQEDEILYELNKATREITAKKDSDDEGLFIPKMFLDA
jgi:hypothetical protein